MALVKVNVVSLRAAQRNPNRMGINRRELPCWSRSSPIGPLDLGGQNDPAAPDIQRLADDFVRFTVR
jgi:hypothetical protein